MTARVSKMLLWSSVGLALLFSTEAAYAQSYHARPRSYDTADHFRVGGPRNSVDPNDVVSGNRVIGRDPDPFIRGEILRHYDSGWPD
jgi:hypothetical protein